MNTKAIFKTLPKNLQEILTNNGITDLYPPQAKAIEQGLLTDKNMILAMPTASGKTLLAELVMLETILTKKGNCLYIVPLRALASEKYDEFKERYEKIGIKIGIATSDFDHSNPSLAKNDILIATAEKVDSLLRQNSSWLGSKLACVISDEIHYIGDPHRGPTLETVLTRLISLNDNLKIVGLSATIANADQIANWLNANLVISSWRPVVLKEGVYCQGKIKFADGTSKELDAQHLKRVNDDISALAIDCVYEKGQTLVFVNTRRSAQAEARRISKDLSAFLTPKDRTQLASLAQELTKSSAEVTKVSKQLSEYTKCGVAFHHAGLHHNHRKLIEENFRKNIIKVICATPTLAVGVNLPSRRTIIRGLYRYASGLGMKPISVMEYKQMSGRAGRPKYDKFGESILYARNKQEQSELFNDFIFADSEPIHSHLGNESALRVHLLASIVTGFISSINTAFDFIHKTFFYYEQKYYDLTEIVLEIIAFLTRQEMIQQKKDKLLPTAFGSRISRLYIDPITAVIIRDCFKGTERMFTPLTLLYLICCVPDMFTLSVNKSDLEKIIPYIDSHKDEFQLPLPLSEDFNSHLARIKTVWMISQWINEEKEESICDFFGTGPGDIYRFMDTAEWLLYSTIELAKLFKIPGTKPLINLRTQLKYGVKSELLELVNLKGIGRIRARNLFNNGYKTISNLKTVSVEKLQEVPNVGKEIALNIKKQVDEF
ncbi:MAG: DEAD/DEAH box helicase [Candidatus Omnitrophota bacterium]